MSGEGGLPVVASSAGVNAERSEDDEKAQDGARGDVCIEVDVPLTSMDIRDNINSNDGTSETVKRHDEVPTVSSTPRDARALSKKDSLASGRSGRKMSKKRSTRKRKKTCEDGPVESTALREETNTATVPAAIQPAAQPEPFESLVPHRDISRPSSRGSMASSFNGVADADFLNKYKQLKLLLKEKETEVQKLEEESRLAEIQREAERLAREEMEKPKPTWIWQKIIRKPEEPEIPDPAVIMRRMRRRRMLALVAMGLFVIALPIAAVILVRPLITA